MYTSREHPTFFRWENFSEQGNWTISGDTIILNPQLLSKPFIETDFQENKTGNDTLLYLTFNHIKRYFDNNGKVIRADTLQVDRLDYSFNQLKKKKLNRIAKRSTTRCSFTGYIPPETITSNKTIVVSKPSEKLESIFIGCYELRETKEFKIKDPMSNQLTLNLYSNYYQDGQLRQKKILIKNTNRLYSQQTLNGKFDKGNRAYGTVLKKEKSSS